MKRGWGGREYGAKGSMGRKGVWGGSKAGVEGSMGQKGAWGARHTPTHHPPLAPSSYGISQPAGRHLPYRTQSLPLKGVRDFVFKIFVRASLLELRGRASFADVGGPFATGSTTSTPACQCASFLCGAHGCMRVHCTIQHSARGFSSLRVGRVRVTAGLARPGQLFS